MRPPTGGRARLTAAALPPGRSGCRRRSRTCPPTASGSADARGLRPRSCRSASWRSGRTRSASPRHRHTPVLPPRSARRRSRGPDPRRACRTGPAGPTRQSGSLAQQRHEGRGRDIGRRRRAIGQEGIREGRQARWSRRPAGDDQPAATGDPAAERGDLLRRQLVRVDVLPDEAVEGTPRLDPIRAGRRAAARSSAA